MPELRDLIQKSQLLYSKAFPGAKWREQEKEGEERLNLDKMRAMMNDQNQDDKLKQNEELAKMRADTSIQKTILSKTIPPAKGIPDAISIVRKGE